MKNVLLISVLTLWGINSFAQLDITTSPAGFFLGSANIYLDKSIDKNWSLETGISYTYETYNVTETDYKSKGGVLRLVGKYYFNENKMTSGYYLGPYLRGGLTSIDANNDDLNYRRLGIGPFTGYKWVIKEKLILEVAIGTGYAVISKYKTNDSSFPIDNWPLDKLDITGKISIGYRF